MEAATTHRRLVEATGAAAPASKSPPIGSTRGTGRSALPLASHRWFAKNAEEPGWGEVPWGGPSAGLYRQLGLPLPQADDALATPPAVAQDIRPSRQRMRILQRGSAAESGIPRALPRY